jgi:hypothetical protein
MTRPDERSSSESDRLEAAVEDLLDHLHDDLPPGPPSELGGEVPSSRRRRTEADFRRMAAIGKAIVDNHIASRRRDNHSR